ncbi:MAG: Ig-like domain-containing protein, partial [Gemmatimonadetes bacterium]|nr:Ig-like domain-containing protein [Gemmatimonadota bacterium]
MLLVMAGAAACADRDTLTSVHTAPEPSAPVSAQFRCDADVRAGTLACAPATAGARGDLLVGGQNVFVKVRSSNVTSSGGQFAFDVSLQNLLAQPMGTTDGITPAPTGTRIFFVSGPTTTGGTGSTAVQNPDGVGAFTTAGQPYYTYSGIIAPGATSAGKHWILGVDPGVTAFSFLLLVSAPMPKESGWISISEPNQTVGPGSTTSLTATVHTATGTVLDGQTVDWASSNSAVATVDAGGTVTGVAPGTATITATSGLRGGTTTVTVAAVDNTPPALTGFSVSPSSVNAGDSVAFTATVTDA